MPMRLAVALLAAAAWWPALSEPEAARPADSAGSTPWAGPPAEAAPGSAPAARDVPSDSEAAASDEETASDEEAASDEESSDDAAPSEETAGEDPAAAAAAANATEQARLDLEAVVSASEAAVSSASLRGSSGWWGHGVSGETCCMCSRHEGWTTVLYAAEDYSYSHGVHSALWECQHECEHKCYSKGGHYFGCYDEQHIVIMDQLYGHRSNYRVLHDDHYGDIC